MTSDDNMQTTCPLQDPEMPLWLSDHAQDFLTGMLLKDPSRRSTAAQLLKHPWLKSLGFKPPANQVPTSVEVVEPVLPPRPAAAAPQPEPEAVLITEPTVAEEPIAKAESIPAVVPQVEVPAAGKKAWRAVELQKQFEMFLHCLACPILPTFLCVWEQLGGIALPVT